MKLICEVIFFEVSLALILSLFMLGSGGNVKNVVIHEVSSDIYSQEEISRRRADRSERVARSWSGCTLTEIGYAGDEAVGRHQDYLSRYNASDVIVLLSTFNVDSSGGDGSLKPNSTCKTGAECSSVQAAAAGSSSIRDIRATDKNRRFNMMQWYRITKYDPAFRDNGIYTRDEWTSISDVGKTYNGVPFSMDEYVKVESNYIACVKSIMRHLGVTTFAISALEVYRSGTNIEDGGTVSGKWVFT